MGNNTNSSDQAWDSARLLVGNGLLSVIMPAFNLEKFISANLMTVESLLNGKLPFEIIIVDDGSTDNTAGVIAETAASHPAIRPVYLKRNVGKGAALREGFLASKGSYVLFLDADLDIPPEQIPAFFDAIKSLNVDMVLGSKHHPDAYIESYPWHRKIVSSVYYAIVKLLMNLPVRDTQTGLKLFKREVLEFAFHRLLVKEFAFDIELLVVAHEKGFKFAELPVSLNTHGKWPVVRLSSIRQVFLDTLAVFYRLRILHFYQKIPEIKTPSRAPLVSIVIAYPAATNYLDECLEGIAQQSYTNREIILLPDEPSGLSWPAGIREIPTGKIRPAEKRNIGIRNAAGEVIAFLDDDVIPLENWLRHAMVYFANENIAAVGGPASTPVNDAMMARLSGKVYANSLVSGPYRYRYEPGIVQYVEDYPSCNLIVRTDVIKKLSGFRTDFWPGEDTYLCLDIIKKLNLKILYDPRVEVYHHRRKLFLPHLRQIGRYAMHRGYFAKKFPETSRKLSYMLPSLFVAGLVGGAAASCLAPCLLPLYVTALLAYAVISMLSSFCFNPVHWIIVWIGVVLTHIVYGIRFVVGLLASKLPDEKQNFDHPSEMEKAK